MAHSPSNNNQMQRRSSACVLGWWDAWWVASPQVFDCWMSDSRRMASPLMIDGGWPMDGQSIIADVRHGRLQINCCCAPCARQPMQGLFKGQELVLEQKPEMKRCTYFLCFRICAFAQRICASACTFVASWKYFIFIYILINLWLSSKCMMNLISLIFSGGWNMQLVNVL